MRPRLGGPNRFAPFSRSMKGWLSLAAALAVVTAGVATALTVSHGEQKISAVSSPRSVPRSSARKTGPGHGTPKAGTPVSATTPGSSTSKSATGSAGARPSPTPSAPFPTAFDVAARFGSACIRPGERQTITITTLSKTSVAYHATYSDGKNAFDPGYYGGNNGGVTDANGRWTDSWVVGAGAPPGRVKVDVVAQGNGGTRGYTLVFFDVADSVGKCRT
jgi:hypothetical protein